MPRAWAGWPDRDRTERGRERVEGDREAKVAPTRERDNRNQLRLINLCQLRPLQQSGSVSIRIDGQQQQQQRGGRLLLVMRERVRQRVGDDSKSIRITNTRGKSCPSVDSANEGARVRALARSLAVGQDWPCVCLKCRKRRRRPAAASTDNFRYLIGRQCQASGNAGTR